MAAARYEIISQSDKGILLRDLGPHEIYLTITNDAENVIKALKLPFGKRCLYYDSEGELTELCHDGKSNFTGFKYG